MPITKSAQKALRQNTKKRIRNLRNKRTLKKLLKEVRVLIEQKKVKQAQELLPQTYKTIDKMTKTGYIKKNKAAREKSKIAKKLNALSAKS
ncbi:MAG: 30S ribosomal protein S20 [Candidatus Pacebacteria bacterium]|nr:30S ribosomal protein S20 [Candidatus Paceibacterota bacterium]